MVSKSQFTALCVTGLLAGNELGTLIGFHPAARTLPLRSQIEAEQAFTARLGKFMPFYIASSLTAAGVAAIHRRGRPGFALSLLSVAATAGMLGITVVAELPLNKQTIDFPLDGDAEDFGTVRRRWERFHKARVVLDLVAFGSLGLAAIEQPPAE